MVNVGCLWPQFISQTNDSNVMVTLMMVVLMVMMILTTTQPDQRALPGVPLDHCRRHRLLHHDADGDDLEIYGRGAQHYHLFD